MKVNRLALIGFSLILSACLTGAVAWAAETYEIRGATAGTLQHPRDSAGKKFIEMVEARSGGRIKGKWYHSGQVGGEADILSQLNNDTLQFANVSCALAGTLNPKVMTMYTPYLIKDWGMFFNNWVGSEGAKLILESLKENGLMGIGWLPYGFNALAYKDPPIRTLEECKGRKIRAAQSYTIKGTLEALGLNAPPIPWPEVYQSVQQKVVDGFTAPPGMVTSGRFYEVINNITLSDHLFGTHVYWFREQSFKKLPSDLQKIVIDSMLEACSQEQKELKDYDEKAVEELKGKGVKAWSLSPQEKARWVAATRKVVIDHEKKIDEKSHDGRSFMRTLYKSLGRNYDGEVYGAK
jgi:TRAP-type transport system periplasmic protein